MIDLVLAFAGGFLVAAGLLWFSNSPEKARVAETPDEDPRPDPPSPGHIPSSVKQAGAEARKAQAEADRAELDLQERRGELVETEAVVELLRESSLLSPSSADTLAEEVRDL